MKKKQDSNPAFASHYQRLSRLTLAAICIVILTHLGLNTSFHGHEILDNQAQATAQSLGKQFALSAVPYVIEEDIAGLSQLTNNFASDAFIQSAYVFDKYGLLIAKSDNSSLYSNLLETPNSVPGITTLSSPIVQNIMHNEKRIGFARITYSFPAAIKTGHEYLHDVSQQIALMLIVSCILTWVLARKIKRWQVKRYILKSETSDENQLEFDENEEQQQAIERIQVKEQEQEQKKESANKSNE